MSEDVRIPVTFQMVCIRQIGIESRSGPKKYNAGPDIICNSRASQALSPFIFNNDDITIKDVSRCCILRVDQQGFSILNFSLPTERPGVELAMQACLRLARDQVQRPVIRCAAKLFAGFQPSWMTGTILIPKRVNHL